MKTACTKKDMKIRPEGILSACLEEDMCIQSTS